MDTIIPEDITSEEEQI